MEIDGDRLVGGAYFEKFVSWYVVFRPATSEFVQNAQFLNLWGEGICTSCTKKSFLEIFLKKTIAILK